MHSSALENGQSTRFSFHEPPTEYSQPITILNDRHINLTASLSEAVFRQQRSRSELPVQPPPKESYREVDAREGAFTVEQRFQVRYEQEFLCAACGKPCRGGHFEEPLLTIHHIVPLKQHGGNNRENAVGLCPEDHKIFDSLALEYNLFPIPVTEAMKNFPTAINETARIQMSGEIEFAPKNPGHKRLRKGKKVKTPEEIKRHQERIRRNQKLPPASPSQVDVFTLNMLGAD